MLTMQWLMIYKDWLSIMCLHNVSMTSTNSLFLLLKDKWREKGVKMVGEASRYIRGKRRDRNDRKTSFPLIRSETQKSVSRMQLVGTQWVNRILKKQKPIYFTLINICNLRLSHIFYRHFCKIKLVLEINLVVLFLLQWPAFKTQKVKNTKHSAE